MNASLQTLYKQAKSTLDLGEPVSAGKHLAAIVKFLMQRIPVEKREKSMNKLRYKLWNLNEMVIANKKTPSSASMGQSITFIKTVLNGHNPSYIRDVLTNIVRNLY